MRDGLKIIVLPGSRYYNVVRIGWLRRVSGDEYELVNARTVVRTASYEAGGLARLASHGIEKRYKLSTADEGVEEIHRLVIRRSMPATEKSWAKDCPKPKGWTVPQ
jgi:hypothetical protein